MTARKAASQPRPRGRPKSYDADVALARATELFWARGYSGTSMRDLTSTMELVPKSLYAEFGDKESLFLAAIQLYIKQH